MSMMVNEYNMEDHLCPACGKAYDPSDYNGETVFCGYCGYKKMLRTPLQKKRENTVLKNKAEFISGGSFFSMISSLFAIPAILALCIFLSPMSFADVWADHRVGCIIYIAMTGYGLITFGLIAYGLPRTHRKIRNHGYDMDWARAQFRKKRGGYKKLSLKLWGINLSELEEEIKKYR